MSDQSKFIPKLRQLLRPFARLCIRNGFRLQEILEPLKGAFVDAAVDELRAAGAEESVSKISVMSGVHRRDVSNFIKADQLPESAPSLLGKIIGQWQESKTFTDKNGKPRALSVEGAMSEFGSLVKSVSSDLNPYTVLFELERINAIKKIDDRVSLVRNILDFQGNMLAGVEILAHDTADLYRAVEENCSLSEPIPNLHIRTEYDSIPVEHARDLKLWILGEGAKFQEKIQRHLSKFDVDVLKKKRQPEDKYCRISVSSVGLVDESKS